MIGLFCKRALYKRRYSANETYNLKELTNRSHRITDDAKTKCRQCQQTLKASLQDYLPAFTF